MLFATLIFKESVTIEEFKIANLLKNIEEALKCNIKNLVIAPAYYKEESGINIEKVKGIVDKLNSFLEERNLDMKLYSANLLMDNYETVKYYINGNVGTINNSNYILLSVEESEKIKDLLEIIYEYRLRNLVPIIVSPEKINEITDNKKNISTLIEEGCLFQLDPASLTGKFGKEVQKTAKLLMKKRIYQFVGFNEKIQPELINKAIVNLSKESLFIFKR